MNTKDKHGKNSNLPKGWTITNIGMICSTQYGYTTSASDYGDVKLLRTTDITSDKINWETVPYCKNNPKQIDKYLLKNNDIVISRAGSVGYSFLVQSPPVAIFASYLIRVKTLIFPKFLSYFLQSNLYWNSIHEKKVGVGLQNVNATKIRQIKIPIPPLNEQKRIVSKIESIFTQIDNIQTNLKNIRETLKQCKQSTLTKAFEGNLISSNTISKKTNTKNKWKQSDIGDICELIGGGTPSRQHSEYFKGNILWLTPTEVNKNSIEKITTTKEKITELGLKKSSARLIPTGSVLLTSRATVGYVAIAGTELTTNQGFASFICSDVIHNYFLAYWLINNRDMLLNSGTGTTYKEITKTIIKKLKISYPTLDEQKLIVTKIESIFNRIDMIDEYVENILLKINMLKKSVLQHAFEGKLVPQDPNDESAHILLEKIKKQNTKITQTKPKKRIKNGK